MKKVIKAVIDTSPKDVFYFGLEIYIFIMTFLFEHTFFNNLVIVIIGLFLIFDLIRFYIFASRFLKGEKK